MKGQTSILIKGIYLILILVSIAIFINRIFYSNLTSAQQERNLMLKNRANRLLDVLAGDVNCLGYEEKGSVEKKVIELSSHRILEKKKLDDFSKFNDIQPDCARDFDFGYRVDVETFPLYISSAEVERKGGVFGKLLSIINGKKVVFVLDVSGSMGNYGGKCDVDHDRDTKICCLKLFMYGFIEGMSDDSEIAVIPFGDESGCNPRLLFDFTRLNGFSTREELKKKISSLSPKHGTPMAAGLKKGFEYAFANGGEAIVLLTDGVENECIPPNSIDVARSFKYTGIPVYTVAYGSVADTGVLQEIASISNGQFFDARMCEELVSKPKESLEVEIPPMKWSFGDAEFSRKESLRQKISVSIPINVLVDEKTIIPGKMTITIFDGELEEFRGFLDKSCLTNTNFRKTFTFHYPLHFDSSNKKLCLEIDGKEFCQKIKCEKNIKFPKKISPGKYDVIIRNEGDELEVMI
ncbi:MAG: VWA domain-containing protein [Candidatus Aenigmatarchaeota archaeon]